MTNKNYLEALDLSLQDICSNNAPFGGKVLIMGRDFCQVLPVVRKGTKAQMISACIIQSHLWDHTKILRLRQNMRSLHDQEFAEFLIRIGDGVEPTKVDDMVRLPSHIAIPWDSEHSIQVLIQHIFPNLELHGWYAPYMVQRAILTPTNDDVQKLNDMIIDQFPGEEHTGKLEHGEIFQLCKELRRKNIETCFDIKIGDFEDKWNTWKDEQTISSIGKLDNKVYLLFPQYV
ncbi:uncharacterized protein LOC127129963 [Lathyrus oleraceus]|uniref:uncharacterized protein LOC127129963 n=1 Tax=Pisum sativum TaxID=3888 RepID=UPI0021CF14A2|nr:uncharacterized protein LOC127129963 [Pisum sativum]